jgi:lambda family phage portal protein
MKRTLIDRLVGFFSPGAEQRRLQARMGLEMSLRAYDIAKTFPQSDWVSVNANDPNEETKSAIAPGREKVRSLAQNNPYALKAINVVVSETVGSGIVPNIQGRNKTETKLLQQLWKEWADTTNCDYYGQQNFYALQASVMKSIVESGEALLIKGLEQNGPKLKQLEADYIDTNRDDGNVKQGIELDQKERRTKYWLFTKHPGGKLASAESIPVDAKQVIHAYRKDRPGQLRGITWAHAVVEKLKDFDDYQYATLVRQKIAACFGGFITTPDSGGGLTASQLKAKRQAEFDLQPNTWRYLNPGEDVKLASPPGVDGYDSFNRETLRAIANGFGVSYESLSGDYSQSNYSSSRMGHLQMRKNIESWRWNIIVPQFCEPAFEMFKEWVRLTKGIKPESIKCEWVPPAYSMIDPSKEIESLKKEVRAGFKSYGQALLELGQDPERTLEEVAKWNLEFDNAKVVLDIDPRRMSQQGLAQASDPLNPEQNLEGEKESDEQDQEDASSESDSSGG